LPSYFCPFVSSAFSWHLLLLKRKQKHTHTKKKKCKEGRDLTFLLLLLHLEWNILLAFSSAHSFNIELSTFLKPWVSQLVEALCYSSLGDVPNSWDGMSGKWGERVGRGKVGRRAGGGGWK
jgi:hypothetical protein